MPFLHRPHLMFQNDNAWPHVARICTQFLETENVPCYSMACTLTIYITHWACLGCPGSTCTTVCSSSHQYPATSHSHWRGVWQYTTGHNQQPDQLYAKEMCCTAWGKWCSLQIMTCFLIHAPTFFSKVSMTNRCISVFPVIHTHRLGPNEFISTDWFPYMNCNAVKSLKLLHLFIWWYWGVYHISHRLH